MVFIILDSHSPGWLLQPAGYQTPKGWQQDPPNPIFDTLYCLGSLRGTQLLRIGSRPRDVLFLKNLDQFLDEEQTDAGEE